MGDNNADPRIAGGVSGIKPLHGIWHIVEKRLFLVFFLPSLPQTSSQPSVCMGVGVGEGVGGTNKTD